MTRTRRCGNLGSAVAPSVILTSRDLPRVAVPWGLDLPCPEQLLPWKLRGHPVPVNLRREPTISGKITITRQSHPRSIRTPLFRQSIAPSMTFHLAFAAAIGLTTDSLLSKFGSIAGQIIDGGV